MKAKLQNRQSSSRSFTLIELLVVIAVIALLAALLTPALKRARGMTKSAYCLIFFRAVKNGKDGRLPLTVAVGESLRDYLQHARPGRAFTEVFLTCRAPYQPLPNSSSLSEIVRRHIRGAGIEVRSKGAHAFRHGFATRMVAAGHSLKAVADVLGHRHLSTTFIYTKVDFHALKEVALDWPEEVRA